MTIWIAVAAVVVVGAITTAVIMTESAKETAKTNAEAQKYTADQARIAQVESAKAAADAEKHGYDTDLAMEKLVMSQDKYEFDKEFENEQYAESARWQMLDAVYGGDDPADFIYEAPYDYGDSSGSGYDSSGDPMLS